MNEDIYLKLREHLDRLPGGFPATESGVELKLLKKLFTPEEAEIAVQLRLMPEPVSSIAERLGMDEAKAEEKLESMAGQGSIYRIRIGEHALYMAYQFVIGVYEFHLNTIDRELSELMEEYIPYIARVWESTKTLQLRVVPVGSAVDATPAVATYNRARELLKNQELIAVAPCICRKEQGLMGNECERPHETCLTFAHAAQYYIDNGIGRRISEDEALKLLELAEESGLVISPTNAREIINICLCCGCCCGVLRGLKLFERPADHVNSPYLARIETELCSACGTCLERCQIDAIEEGEEAMEVDPARCIGCGLCLPTCPEEAITLVEKPGTDAPPANIVEMLVRIALERGLA